MAEYILKRGATLDLPMNESVAGVGTDLSGYTITSQIRRLNDDATYHDLTVTIDPDQVTNAGDFVVSATAAETLAWDLAIYECDIRMESTDVDFTDTFTIRVVKAITR